MKQRILTIEKKELHSDKDIGFVNADKSGFFYRFGKLLMINIHFQGQKC